MWLPVWEKDPKGRTFTIHIIIKFECAALSKCKYKYMYNDNCLDNNYDYNGIER